MSGSTNIFLPGLEKQSDIFFSQSQTVGKNVLIIGANSEEIAHRFVQKGAASVIIIVDEEDSLFKSKFLLAEYEDLSVRFMDFDNTDFREERFDIIYAQASISTLKRNKILKEIKRILKPEGIFCTGEIVNLLKEVPQFIKDLRNNGGIAALFTDDATTTTANAGFEIISEYNISNTLRNFYYASLDLLRENLHELPDNEKSYYKKMLHMMSHESNAYLKLGGDKYMGFKVILARKKAV